MCQTRIKEVFPNWKSGAIFTALNSREVPWANVFPALSLDLDYYGNFSGNKIISGLVENILPSDGVLTAEEIIILCDVIMGLYSLKWGKLWETMQLDYNPIENYSMVEQMINDATVKDYGKTSTRTDNLTSERTDNLSRQRTDNLTHERTDNLEKERTDNLSTQRTDNLTHERTDNLEKERTDNLSAQRTDNLTHGKTGTETETPNTTTQDDNSVFGFNSDNAVPSDSRSIRNTGTNQKTYNTQETDTGTQTQLNTGTQTETNKGTQTETDTGTQTQLNTGTQTETNTGTQTETDTGTQTETDTGTQTNRETGTQSFVDGGRDTETRNYRLTRSGNIGVTTSQQMIEAERELWRMWNFFRGIVYPDIDRVLTIEIY